MRGILVATGANFRMVDPRSVLLSLLIALVACASPPCRSRSPGVTARNPVQVLHQAEMEAKAGQDDRALADYLWDLDFGEEFDDGFMAWVTVQPIMDLAKRHPAARSALEERQSKLIRDVELAARNGNGDLTASHGARFRRCGLQFRDLHALVVIGFALDGGARVHDAYHEVANALPAESHLRADLWSFIEDELVEARRYREAAAEPHIARRRIDQLLALAEPIRKNADEATMTVKVLSTHYEALIGTGDLPAAEALAERLITFSPRAGTFVELIRRARRAGAREVAVKLREGAYEMLPASDRLQIDEAFGTS